MQNLGTLPGSMGAAAIAINNSGQVAGWNVYSNGNEDAFLYSGETMQDLGTLPGGLWSRAWGMNNNGQVVGSAYTSSGGNQHAFLYDNGEMEDLNNLIPVSSDWTLLVASAINDNGQIVGQGINPSGQTDAFLLTPISTPEPSTLSLLIVGAVGLLAFAWRTNARQTLPLKTILCSGRVEVKTGVHGPP
jgi:probable HAF family extracellular repeat protein